MLAFCGTLAGSNSITNLLVHEGYSSRSMCEVSVTVLAATHWEGLGTRLMVSS